MSLSTLDLRTTYAGNDVATAFPFAFKVLAADDLKVTRFPSTGIGSVLVRGVDYSVAGVGADAGGTVTLLLGALATGSTLMLEREVDLTQPLSLRSQGGGYSPESLEDEFDRLTMQLQQIDDYVRNAADPSSPPTRYTTATRPTPSSLWAGITIRVKDDGVAEREQVCLQQADTSWAWIDLIRVTTDASLVWDPGSITNGAALTSSAIAITGVAFGDFVVVAPPVDLAGLSCTGYVSSSGNVKITLANNTGSAVDLASGTWKVRVLKNLGY